MLIAILDAAAGNRGKSPGKDRTAGDLCPNANELDRLKSTCWPKPSTMAFVVLHLRARGFAPVTSVE
jgi:hypothetical protein